MKGDQRRPKGVRCDAKRIAAFKNTPGWADRAGHATKRVFVWSTEAVSRHGTESRACLSNAVAC